MADDQLENSVREIFSDKNYEHFYKFIRQRSSPVARILYNEMIDRSGLELQEKIEIKSIIDEYLGERGIDIAGSEIITKDGTKYNMFFDTCNKNFDAKTLLNNKIVSLSDIEKDGVYKHCDDLVREGTFIFRGLSFWPKMVEFIEKNADHFCNLDIRMYIDRGISIDPRYGTIYWNPDWNSRVFINITN